MSLPTDYQRYYVYRHVEPITGEVLYVGSGSKDRAWHYRVSMSRSREHMDYLDALTSDGYLPADWVEIIARNLSKEAARSEEQKWIDKLQPPFNKHKGPGSMIDKKVVATAQELLSRGVVGREAAEKLKCSVMTAWRYQYVY